MNYELTVTLRLQSPRGQERITKNIGALFQYGTIKESIVDGLQLLKDPELTTVAVRRLPRGGVADAATAA